jgi:carboxyl-terminal processing protease
MITRRTALGLVAAPLLWACDESIVWTPIGDADERAFGVWESAATGHVVALSQAGAEVFHRLDGFWITDPDLVPPFALFALVGDSLLMQHYDYRAMPFLLQAPMVLARSETLIPAAPLHQSDAMAPGAVFELICDSFERHYAFFEERGVDWTAAQSAATPRVLQAQDNDAIFDILVDLLAPLGDGHVNLSLRERRFNAGRSALRARLAEAWRGSDTAQTEQEYVSAWSRDSRASAITMLDAGSHRTAGAGALEWGVVGGDTGYLRINRFTGFAEGDAPRQEQVAALQAALAEAERHFAGASHIIVDVAHNGGGNDAAALVAAQHFADQPRRVLEYRARQAPNQPIHLAPGAGAYPRPVTLVTSEITASAAECFVLMMRAFPHVTHVGGKTRGILSSLLPKPFPNGFMATIAYQQVLDANGDLYEARSIPPAREIELFPDEDLSGAYARAIRALASA